METRQFIPSSHPRKSWKWSGRGRQGARAGGGAPTSAAATRFLGTCLKGSGCRDLSGSRRGELELERRGGCHRRGAGACGIRGVTSTWRVPRGGGDEIADPLAGLEGQGLPGICVPGSAGVPAPGTWRPRGLDEVQGVRPGPHY